MPFPNEKVVELVEGFGKKLDQFDDKFNAKLDKLAEKLDAETKAIRSELSGVNADLSGFKARGHAAIATGVAIILFVAGQAVTGFQSAARLNATVERQTERINGLTEKIDNLGKLVESRGPRSALEPAAAVSGQVRELVAKLNELSGKLDRPDAGNAPKEREFVTATFPARRSQVLGDTGVELWASSADFRPGGLQEGARPVELLRPTPSNYLAVSDQGKGPARVTLDYRLSGGSRLLLDFPDASTRNEFLHFMAESSKGEGAVFGRTIVLKVFND